MIEKGLCQCGCGEQTKTIPYNDSKKGFIKGQPYRFIAGHQNRGKRGAELIGIWKGGKVSQNGYVQIRNTIHSRAGRRGYVLEHILIAEKALGKPLPEGVIVHHHNEKRDDNETPGNLVICQDTSYHRLLHQRMAALKACGHANWLKCKRCGLYDDPNFMRLQNNGRAGSHRECENEYERKRVKNHG